MRLPNSRHPERSRGSPLRAEQVAPRDPSTALRSAGDDGNFRRRLLRWYRANGRKLPWRRTRDPYAILVSEIMLQQTRASAVVPYYTRWLGRFPRFETLARARQSSVLHAWQGLGYYARARNLQCCAKIIVEQFGGNFPRDPGERESLPGIGRYTANAIGVFAFDQTLPLVEANIARVLSRLFNIRESINSTSGRKKLWRSSAALVPAKGARDFQNALMDLGALVCTAHYPKCEICPVKNFCRAPDPLSLPRKRRRPLLKQLIEKHFFRVRAGKVLLEQSPRRWRGMWILPPLTSAESAPPVYAANFPFTNHRITLEIFRSHARAANANQRWFPLPQLKNIPVPSPHRRALDALLVTPR